MGSPKQELFLDFGFILSQILIEFTIVFLKKYAKYVGKSLNIWTNFDDFSNWRELNTALFQNVIVSKQLCLYRHTLLTSLPLISFTIPCLSGMTSFKLCLLPIK